MPRTSSPPRKARLAAAAADRELRPALRKALGQHHLRSGATCRPLLDFLQPAGRLVVEVGPGGGVLTRELLGAGAHVLALELDTDWAQELAERLPSADLEIRVADALDFDWRALPPGTRVAGNLPYNVGTAIVERILHAHPPLERAAFLLQREVVDRLVAGPGDEAYGSLSVLTALHAEAAKLGNVRRGSFVPPPKVDSAFVGFSLRPRFPQVGPEELKRFENWLRAAFQQRRKTLVNSLSTRHTRDELLAALAGESQAANIRAEALSLTELFQLFSRLEGSGLESQVPL